MSNEPVDDPVDPVDHDAAEAQDGKDRGIPQVAAPKRGNNILIGVFLAIMTGLLLYFVNSGGETEAPELTDKTETEFQVTRRQEAPVVPVAEPVAPQLPAQQQQAPQQVQTQPETDPFLVEQQRRLAQIALREAEEARRLAEQRRRSPILIYDESRTNSTGTDPAVLSAQQTGTTPSSLFPSANAAGEALSSSEQFAARVSNETVKTATATRLQNQHALIAQGSLIRGVLETAIQSDLPGFIRAQVSHEVYSFDGSTLLIPKGSRLVGRYQSGLVEGQTRIFVIWSRVLLPDGVSVQIGSPGTDPLGRAGLSGFLDTHFVKRFGSSALLSIVGGATAALGSNGNNNGTDRIVLGTADSFNRSAEIALENSINIPPTIFVDQGAQIQVFVARDLDFSSVQ